MDPFRISPFCASVRHQLAEPFFHWSNKSRTVSIRNPVRLDEYNELQPDVILLKKSPNDYRTQLPARKTCCF